MNQYDRQQKQKQEKEKQEFLEFLQGCFNRLMRFQLTNEIIVVPMMMEQNDPLKGTHITPELTFRKMTSEDQKAMEEVLAKSAGLELPK